MRAEDTERGELGVIALPGMLILDDPGGLRLRNALRGVFGLVLAAGAALAVARATGQDPRSSFLAMMTGQLLLIAGRGPVRAARLRACLAAVAGALAGIAIYHLIAAMGFAQVLVAPWLIALAMLAALGGPLAAAAGLGAAWLHLFAVIFAIPAEDLGWHLAVTALGGAMMIMARFFLWPEDRPADRRAVLRAFRLALAAALTRSTQPESNRLAIFRALQIRRAGVVSALNSPEGSPVDLIAALDEAMLRAERAALDPEDSIPAAERLLLADALRAGVPIPARHADLASALARAEAHLKEPPSALDHQAKPAANRSQILNRAARVTLAATLAAGLGWTVSPDRWVWAVLTAMMLFFGAENSGQIFAKGLRNVIGVTGGIIAGAAIAWALSGDPLVEAGLMLVSITMALYFMPVRYALATVFLTVFIVMSFSLSGQPIAALLELRLGQVMIGVITGMLATFAIPAPSMRSALARDMRRLRDALAAAWRDPGTNRSRDAYADILHSADLGLSLLRNQAALDRDLAAAAWLVHLTDLLEMLPPDDRARLQPQLTALADRIEGKRPGPAAPAPLPGRLNHYIEGLERATNDLIAGI